MESLVPVERLYCKRSILWLASSKMLTNHAPHRPASAYPPPLVRGEDTLAGWRGGWEVNILEDARHSYVLYIRKCFGHAPVCTANNFGLMYSRKSHNSFPNFIYIVPKSFMVFCQELHNPKRNYENQI